GDERHTAEFCENGAKAVAEEATLRRVTDEFFVGDRRRFPETDAGRASVLLPSSGPERERKGHWHDHNRARAGNSGNRARAGNAGTRGKTDPGHDGSRGTGAAVVTRRRLGAGTGVPMPSGAATTTVPEGPTS
ncbi:hypothetical protein, partial [Streptomyces sp. NPDC048845]|uniref:hypothetical protein n=1 Tax=Streptomyces sp. NPDC048845 TaxID=3155390 RepID=UPI00343477DC